MSFFPKKNLKRKQKDHIYGIRSKIIYFCTMLLAAAGLCLLTNFISACLQRNVNKQKICLMDDFICRGGFFTRIMMHHCIEKSLKKMQQRFRTTHSEVKSKQKCNLGKPHKFFSNGASPKVPAEC